MSRNGPLEIRPMGAKSFSVSYETFLMCGSIVSAPGLAMKSV